MKSCPLAEPEKTDDSISIIMSHQEKSTKKFQHVSYSLDKSKENRLERSESRFESIKRFENPEKLLGSTTSSSDQGTVPGLLFYLVLFLFKSNRFFYSYIIILKI